MNQQLSQEELATNAATWDHINTVMRLLASAQIELMRRQFTHDQSKLLPPEVDTFVEFTPKLKGATYGSEEYKGFLAEMKPALDHHYSHNRHHPEFFDSREHDPQIDAQLETLEHVNKYLVTKGWMPDEYQRWQKIEAFLEQKQSEHQSSVNGMTLFDLLEMFIDWAAACQRHADGDINRSIEINQKRFNLSPQLVEIFKNTVPWVKDEFAGLKTQRDLKP
jgi:hypothetical protein